MHGTAGGCCRSCTSADRAHVQEARQAGWPMSQVSVTCEPGLEAARGFGIDLFPQVRRSPRTLLLLACTG